MRVQGGLKPEDWQRWGQFTTIKSNAADLLRRELRSSQRIYCSPLVDPYQPAEAEAGLMPGILEALIESPPLVFTLQTRGPLVLRDVESLASLAKVTRVRVSFSITTNREEIRRLYEPHCATIAERLHVVRTLRAAGIEAHVTLAPLLPCDPEELADMALEASGLDLIGDALHTRVAKPRGATTREGAMQISAKQGLRAWHEPLFQETVVERIRAAANARGLRFETGPAGFALLAQ
jgi:DNA repair photolyase